MCHDTWENLSTTQQGTLHDEHVITLHKANTTNLSRIPLSVDVDGVENLSQEMEKVLSFTTMSVTNNGASFQMNVGLTSQEENHVVANVMKAYKDLSVKFPGGFRNIRSLTLRVGTCAWTVPIYVSYGKGKLLFSFETDVMM